VVNYTTPNNRPHWQWHVIHADTLLQLQKSANELSTNS